MGGEGEASTVEDANPPIAAPRTRITRENFMSKSYNKSL